MLHKVETGDDMPRDMFTVFGSTVIPPRPA